MDSSISEHYPSPYPSSEKILLPYPLSAVKQCQKFPFYETFRPLRRKCSSQAMKLIVPRMGFFALFRLLNFEKIKKRGCVKSL